MIPIGTLCYIVHTGPENAPMLGRVVTVIAPATPQPLHGGALMHRIDAPWLRVTHPNTHVFAPPSALRPIVPPGHTAPALRQRIPERA